MAWKDKHVGRETLHMKLATSARSYLGKKRTYQKLAVEENLSNGSFFIPFAFWLVFHSLCCTPHHVFSRPHLDGWTHGFLRFFLSFPTTAIHPRVYEVATEIPLSSISRRGSVLCTRLSSFLLLGWCHTRPPPLLLTRGWVASHSWVVVSFFST